MSAAAQASRCRSTPPSGGFAAPTIEGWRWLSGIEKADFVTLDPHKRLYQSFECTWLLVREAGMLDRASYQ
jgi:glutamate/tyrosine decarboxylase-like PLP-dependent enzyme